MKTPRIIRKAIFRLGVAAVLILAVAWLITHTGPGGGSGSGGLPLQSSASPPSSIADPSKAIQIAIHEDQYSIDGHVQSLDQVLGTAKSTPSVKIIVGADSRVGSQLDLQKALDNAHIAWSLESGPTT